MEPGLVSSSKAIYLGPRFQNQAFEPGFLINPFTTDSRTTSHGKPVICMTCGGFLNLYCTVDPASGQWACNLCGSSNPSLDSPGAGPHSGSEAERFKHLPQLQSKHVDIVEDVYISPQGAGWSGPSSMVYLFAVDDSLCNVAADIKKFLKTVLAAVPQTHRVGIICYGKCLSLLRLCGGISQSVAVDALPGDGDATAAIDHFIAQGVYLTPAGVALEEVGRIAKTLYLLSNEGSGQAGRRHGDRQAGPEPVSSVEAIVATACALGNVSGNPAVRLLIAAGRSIPHVRASLGAAHGLAEGSLSDGTREARHVSAYARLGRHALFPPRAANSDGGGGCWIDVVRVGPRSIRTDTLEALCGSSGGMVFRSFTLGDSHMLASVAASLRMAEHCFPRGGTVCTLELRSSPGLQVSHVIGPVLSSEDAGEVPGLRLDLASVDVRHLHHSTKDGVKAEELVELSGRHIFEPVRVNKNSYKKLYKYNQEHTLVCGLTRLDPNATVSVQCVPTPDAHRQQRVGFQCVVRFARSCPPSDSAGGPSSGNNRERYQEVIRVMNVQLTCTDDRDLYLQSLDSELWALLMARSVVADFHVSQMQYESLRALQFRSRREDDLAAGAVTTPRDAGIKDIEALVTDVLQQWCPLGNEAELGRIGAEAAERAARTLYHLWLGPLMGGPSMHVQDAFLLRSHFLSVPVRHALRLLCPQMEVAYEPSADELSPEGAAKGKSSNQLPDVGTGDLLDEEAMAAAVSAHPPPSGPPPDLPPPPPPSAGYSDMKPPSSAPPSSGSLDKLVATPDSLWLLPGAIIVIDMGYTIVVWSGGPLLADMKDRINGVSTENGTTAVSAKKGSKGPTAGLYEASLKQALSRCAERAQQRRPAAEMVTVVGGSPAERVALAALSPSHMDRSEVIRATAKHLAVEKWAPYVQDMVDRSPHTDQQSFAMFLVRVSPAHGNEWCRMGSLLPLTEEDRRLKAAQPVPMMDRGLMFGPSMDIIDVL